MKRRNFCKIAGMGLVALPLGQRRILGATDSMSPLFWVKGIPDDPYWQKPSHRHAGVDTLIDLMGGQGLKFYKSSVVSLTSGPRGMIGAGDVVLIKVNAQWKYRGCTNSDVIRGLIQRILEHPKGFHGEVVIFENGQGRGSLRCDTSAAYGDSYVRANANRFSHSFIYLVNQVFKDPRVSAFLLDPIRSNFIGNDDHVQNGYRLLGNVSYPCFTTAGGRRVELKEGTWNGSGHTPNLKLINVPVLKHHDVGGSEITASLKHVYGLLSMADGNSGFRHYAGLGETCGRMLAEVRTPALNIVDAIWVSHASLKGFPADTTFRANQLLASQDPVALDYYAAKYILYPIDKNTRHRPYFSGITSWLTSARQTINRIGITSPENGVYLSRVNQYESQMKVFIAEA